MRYKAICFDLDGTLLDTLEDLADCMNRVLQRHGFPVHPCDNYRYFVGEGARVLVRKTIPHDKQDEELITHCHAEFQEEYGQHWAIRTRPYPGIPELLEALSGTGLMLSVLSNKPHPFTVKTVEYFLSRWNFRVILGQRDGVPRKPDPAGVMEISSTLGATPETMLYLGDTGVDMQTANSAGCYAVGALWGFRGKEELAANGANALISKPMELLPLLEDTR